MLAVTPSAAEVIDQLLASPELPEGAGIRISSGMPPESGDTRMDLRLAVAEEPESDDEVLEGTRVFIEQDTVPILDDKVLDAAVQGNQVQFSIKEQEEGLQPPAP